jgi:hypothetical protein
MPFLSQANRYLPCARNTAYNRSMKFRLAILLLLAALSSVVAQTKNTPSWFSELDKVYSDESHCLTLADMRGDGDMPISCFCRDAIADAHYVWFTYLLTEKDRNLRGVFFTLETKIRDTCGAKASASSPHLRRDWKWDGPEVVRTYPSKEVISRIQPDSQGRRWIPFTVQLVFHNARGDVIRTDTYSSREMDLPASLKPRPK